MEKTAEARKKNSPKAPTAKKRAAPPLADKIPLIRSLILDSVKPGTIKKYTFLALMLTENLQKKATSTCALLSEMILMI